MLLMPLKWLFYQSGIAYAKSKVTMNQDRTKMHRAPKIKYKAFAYITNRNRLLVFIHPFAPEAGIQVPAGTIKADERPKEAVLREAFEETGCQISLSILSLVNMNVICLILGVTRSTIAASTTSVAKGILVLSGDIKSVTPQMTQSRCPLSSSSSGHHCHTMFHL
jgi:NUDIX domain-containing protein